MPKLPANDPRPIPPVRPDNEDCCNSGCSPCVFDLYEEELERYRIALNEWEARRAQKNNPDKPPRR